VILLAELAWSAKRLAGLGPPADPGLRVTGRACLAAGLGGEAGDIEDGDFAPAQVDQATVSELPEGFGGGCAAGTREGGELLMGQGNMDSGAP